MTSTSASRVHHMLARVRTVLVGIAATVPIVVIWPPDQFDPYYGAKAVVIVVVGACLLLWWLAALGTGFISVRRLGAVGFLGMVFALLLVVSSLVSGDPTVAVWGSPGREDGLLVWLTGLLLLATAATVRDARAWRGILTWVVIAAMIVSAYAVVQHFGFNPLDRARWLVHGRSYSTLRNPVFLGGYLSLVLPLVVWWCTERRTGALRVAAGAGLGVCAAALYFSFSRAGWIGTAAGLGGLGVWWLVRDRAQLRTGFPVLVAALVVAVVLGVVPTVRSADTQSHSLGEDAQTIVDIQSPRNAGRLALYGIAVEMIKDHPWLGVGLDQMGRVFPGYRTPEFASAEGPLVTADRAHSDPLQLAVAAGIPAALAFYAMIAAALLAACARVRRVGGARMGMWIPVLGGVMGYLLQSVVSITVPGVHTLFFVLVGALMAAPPMPSSADTAVLASGSRVSPANE